MADYFPGTKISRTPPSEIVPARDFPPLFAEISRIAALGDEPSPTTGAAGEVSMDEMDDKTDPGMAGDKGMDKGAEGAPAAGGDAVVAELAKMLGISPEQAQQVISKAEQSGMSASDLLAAIKKNPSLLAEFQGMFGKKPQASVY
jgi:hypothetical protein